MEETGCVPSTYPLPQQACIALIVLVLIMFQMTEVRLTFWLHAEAQPPLMTQLIVLRASAPHPPTHVPTPNTQHTHTGSNEEPPTQLQTPVCLCWKRGGGYTHSHSRGRNIAIMCAHTHIHTIMAFLLWLRWSDDRR